MNATIVATQLGFDKLRLECTCNECESCTLRGMALLVEVNAECGKVVELGESSKGESNEGLLDSLPQERGDCLLDSLPQEPKVEMPGLLDSLPQECLPDSLLQEPKPDVPVLLDSLPQELPTCVSEAKDTTSAGVPHMLGGTEAEQHALLPSTTCSPRPSGISSKFNHSNKSIPSNPLPKRASTRKFFKFGSRRPKERSVDLSPALTSGKKQKLLEHYFSRDANRTNGDSGKDGSVM